MKSISTGVKGSSCLHFFFPFLFCGIWGQVRSLLSQTDPTEACRNDLSAESSSSKYFPEMVGNCLITVILQNRFVYCSISSECVIWSRARRTPKTLLYIVRFSKPKINAFNHPKFQVPSPCEIRPFLNGKN